MEIASLLNNRRFTKASPKVLNYNPLTHTKSSQQFPLHSRKQSLSDIRSGRSSGGIKNVAPFYQVSRSMVTEENSFSPVRVQQKTGQIRSHLANQGISVISPKITAKTKIRNSVFNPITGERRELNYERKPIRALEVLKFEPFLRSDKKGQFEIKQGSTRLSVGRSHFQ